MKSLLTALAFFSFVASGLSQSIFAGEWIGIITPKCPGWGRTTLWMTIYPNGAVVASQWNFNADEVWDGFEGYVSPKGSISVISDLGDSVTFKVTKAGKGTGTWITPFSDGTGSCRQIVTLFREYN